MRSRRACVVTVLLVAAAGGVPSGHHSISGQFDLGHTVTLKGTIAKVDWINPHPYVYVDVTMGNGRVTRWALSTVPLPMLRKAGVTREALAGQRGEVVTVLAYPGLDRQKNIGWITRITYADGHYYQLSSQ